MLCQHVFVAEAVGRVVVLKSMSSNAYIIINVVASQAISFQAYAGGRRFTIPTCSLPIAVTLFNYKSLQPRRMYPSPPSHRTIDPRLTTVSPRTARALRSSSTTQRTRFLTQHVYSLRPYPPFMWPPSERHSGPLKQYMDLQQPLHVPRDAATG